MFCIYPLFIVFYVSQRALYTKDGFSTIGPKTSSCLKIDIVKGTRRNVFNEDKRKKYGNEDLLGGTTTGIPT